MVHETKSLNPLKHEDVSRDLKLLIKQYRRSSDLIDGKFARRKRELVVGFL